MQDLGVTVGFLCAFLIPLKKLFKSAGPQQTSKLNKIVYAATKTTILTATSTISSLIFPSITAGTGVGLFSGIDLIINPLCMILMTPYYPDNLLYHPLFCICIKLCDKSGKTGKDIVDDDNNKNDKNDKTKDLEPTMTMTVTTTEQSTKSNTNTTTTTTATINSSSVDTMSQIRVVGAKTNPNNYQEINAISPALSPAISPEPPITDIDTDNEQP